MALVTVGKTSAIEIGVLTGTPLFHDFGFESHPDDTDEIDVANATYFRAHEPRDAKSC